MRFCSHSYNKARDMPTVTAAEARQLLCQKAHEHFRDMSRAFCALDKAGKGHVTRQSLREVLRGFLIALSPNQFDELWASLDPQGVGHVSYEALLENLGVPLEKW